ncbi:MAG: hypothetical protein ACHQ01_10620 [Candidatus Limnocylindrales bacterium]
MIALNDAWDVLGDPERRAAYDVTRSNAARSDVSASRAEAAAGQAETTIRYDPGAPRPADATHAGPPPGRPSGTVLNFGRYAGWSLGEVARFDRDYLEWLARSTVGRGLRAELEALLRPRGGAGTGPTGGSGNWPGRR